MTRTAAAKINADKFVSYTRVSTTEQGADGLGVQAQQHAIRQHVESVGGSIVSEFVEVASGDDDTRPKLAAALKVAKQKGAVLIVAKMDRLGRAVASIAGLIRNGTELRVVECAGASTLELHIRAVFAEEERRKIRERTREALAALKRRGVKLGSARPGHWKDREDRRQAGQKKAVAKIAATRRAARSDVFAAALPIAKRLKAQRVSLRGIADQLNAAEITTSRGSSWKASQVSRLLASV